MSSYSSTYSPNFSPLLGLGLSPLFPLPPPPPPFSDPFCSPFPKSPQQSLFPIFPNVNVEDQESQDPSPPFREPFRAFEHLDVGCPSGTLSVTSGGDVEDDCTDVLMEDDFGEDFAGFQCCAPEDSARRTGFVVRFDASPKMFSSRFWPCVVTGKEDPELKFVLVHPPLRQTSPLLECRGFQFSPLRPDLSIPAIANPGRVGSVRQPVQFRCLPPPRDAFVALLARKRTRKVTDDVLRPIGTVKKFSSTNLVPENVLRERIVLMDSRHGVYVVRIPILSTKWVPEANLSAEVHFLATVRAKLVRPLNQDPRFVVPEASTPLFPRETVGGRKRVVLEDRKIVHRLTSLSRVRVEVVRLGNGLRIPCVRAEFQLENLHGPNESILAVRIVAVMFDNTNSERLGAQQTRFLCKKDNQKSDRDAGRFAEFPFLPLPAQSFGLEDVWLKSQGW